MMILRHGMGLATAAAALALVITGPNVGVADPAKPAASLPGPLVTVQWLHDHLNEVTVIDVADNAARLTVAPKIDTDQKTGARNVVAIGGHIPGAIFVDFGKIRQAREVGGVNLVAMMPSKPFFEKVMDDAGLDRGLPIVIAPTGESVEALDMATRLFFQLKYFGEDSIAVLNGGTLAWIGAGYPVSTDAVGVKPGNWTATAERSELLATTADVEATVRNHSAQLVDARPVAQFFGIAKSPVVLAAGHVQGAASFPTEAIALSAGGAKTFMADAQYRAILKQQNINPDQPTIAYCNTGHLASGAWFVMHEILKEKNARLYAGSMNEWTHLNKPVVSLPE